MQGRNRASIVGVLSDANLHFIVHHSTNVFHWHDCSLGQYKTYKRWTHAEAPFFHPHLHKSNMAVSIV